MWRKESWVIKKLKREADLEMIYLDYNSTTPIDKKVAEAMLPFLYDHFGNPSSDHRLGHTTKKAVETARQQVADFLGCSPTEIIFTSSGSESNNMAIKGIAHSYRHKGNHIITSCIEHPSVLNPCKYLESNGFRITYLPIDYSGMVDPEELRKHITNQTILVTIMHSNNETGTLQPILEIAGICRERNIIFHTDASQSAGKVPLNVHELGIDLLTIAGHKLYAPKGVGALYAKNGVHLEPLIHGAGHERGSRAGTENIMFNVGLGKACIVASELAKNDQIKQLTYYFYMQMKAHFGDRISLNGHLEKRLPNTLNISFINYNGHEILAALDNVAASTGSACHSGMAAISPVLKAMDIPENIARGAIRFSLGKYTTTTEVDEVVDKLRKLINKS